MAFSYNYKHKPHNPSGAAKKALIAAVMLILVLGIYSVGSTITGYISYSDSVASELNGTKKELEIYKAVSDECTRDLWLKESDLTACERSFESASASLAACEALAASLSNRTSSLESSLASCSSELQSLKGIFGNLNISYEKLVRNSVKAVCCSFSDVQRSQIRNWGVSPDGIVCSGSFSVNCSSGGTF